MTFLELCQRLVQKAGISGSLVSVVGQTGELGRVVGWIADAYEYIQNKHSDWQFLRRDVTFNAAAGNGKYAAADAGLADFGEWRFVLKWRAYSVAAGVANETPMTYMDYDLFRDTYMLGNARLQAGMPTIITEAPDQSLILWPIPDQAYTIVGEYYRAPALMLANGDLPLFAARFHNVIVHRAMMFYGEYEGDVNTFQNGQTECARVLSMMEDAYLPDWQNAGAMA